jgi:hypothetical protein
MATVGVLLGIGVLLGAALMDLVDRRHGRRRRSVGAMLAARHDELADVWSTQHRGLPSPIDHISKDRGVPKD